MLLDTEKFGKGISLSYSFTPEKKNTGFSIIHVRFVIYHHSIRWKETEVSTGVKCPSEKWTGTSIKGRDVDTQLANERLDSVKKVIK